MEFAPLLTAYNVWPSRGSVTANDAGCGVDHAVRVVVVVGDDQRVAVGGDAHAAGVGPDTEADAPVGMPQRHRGRRAPDAARPGIDIDLVVRTARGVERVAIR